jgi:hypothetical protein
MLKKSLKGVSLPMIIGLVTLLMIASLSANETILRAMRSVRGIESSNRAYFAAEAGVEDALYELSPHYPGYQTPTLPNTLVANSDVRKSDFGGSAVWKNQWQVESRAKGNEATAKGQFYKNQKLIFSFFRDENSATSAPASNGIDDSAIESGKIVNLRPGNLEITFSIPLSASGGGGTIKIDNDEDGSYNEDPEGPASACNTQTKAGCLCPNNPSDDDCDGRVDEDGPNDPVILWKMTSENGHSLIPLRGCLLASTPIAPKSELCESDFKTVIPPDGPAGRPEDSTKYVTLKSDATGINELGNNETIYNFINQANPDGSLNTRIQFEFLIVAPMKYLDLHSVAQKEIPIPYYEYKIKGDQTPLEIPFPYFSIKSDGYYATYKQSVTATVTTKTSVPLFDFTIIQQK